jgi:very-short-patch-repair endonuclease
MHSPTTDRARELRNNMTKAEWRIWSRLRNRQVAGYKFRRQFPIGPYFADFACLSARLVIEVDGEGHDKVSDDRKTAYLQSRGYQVVRVPVQEIDETMEDVMDAIYLVLVSGHAETCLAPPGANAPTSPPGGEVKPESLTRPTRR